MHKICCFVVLIFFFVIEQEIIVSVVSCSQQNFTPPRALPFKAAHCIKFAS